MSQLNNISKLTASSRFALTEKSVVERAPSDDNGWAASESDISREVENLRVRYNVQLKFLFESRVRNYNATVTGLQ